MKQYGNPELEPSPSTELRLMSEADLSLMLIGVDERVARTIRGLGPKLMFKGLVSTDERGEALVPCPVAAMWPWKYTIGGLSH